MSLSQQTFIAGKWQGLSMFLRGTIHYISVIIMARYVTPDEYGVAALSFVILEFSNLFINAGFGPALIQKTKISSLHIRTAFTSTVFLGIIFYIIIYFLSPYLSSFIGEKRLEDVLLIMGIILIIRGFGACSKALLQRKLRFKTLMYINVTSLILGYVIVGISMAINGFGYWAFIYASLVFAFSSAILSVVACKHNLIPFFSKKEFFEIAYFGSGLTLSRFFNFTGKNGDKIVVSKMLGTTLLGNYEMSFKLMLLPIKNLGNLIDQVMFPIMSKVKNDLQKLQKIFFRLIAFVLLIIFPINAFLFIMAKEIIITLLGMKWLIIVIPFKILLCASIFKIITRVCDILIRAKGAVFSSAFRKLFFSILIIVLAWLGSFRGIEGVAIGINVAVAITSVIMLNLCFKLLGSSDYKKLFSMLISPLLLGIVTLLITYFSKYLVEIYFVNPIVILFINSSLIITILLVIIYYYPHTIGETGNWFLSIFKDKYRHRFSFIEKLNIK